VTERQNGARKDERIYLGGFEIYREYDGAGASVSLERETLQVIDDKQRIAMVETKTVENGAPINDPIPLQRYQLSNHLGSASLELDQNGALISYEEYHPYGTTAYQAMNSAAEVSLKRYRYTGKERDEETGLYYHGARYYICWLGRWTSTDPAMMVDGPNLYNYVRGNPVRWTDPTGSQSSAGANDVLFQGMVTIEGKEYRQFTNFAGDFVWQEPVEVEQKSSPEPQKPTPRPGPPKELMQELEKYKDIPDEPIDESAGLPPEALDDAAEPPIDEPAELPTEETPESSEESLKDSPVVQFLGGAVIGGLQGWLPFGIVGNVVNMPTKYSELGRGVGEAAMGVAQIVGGLGAIIGGGGAAAGGVVAAPVTGGGSLLVSLAGGSVVAVGAASVVQGVTNLAAGISSIQHSMSMRDPGPEEIVPSLRPDRAPGTSKHPFEGIPKGLHPQIFDIISDLQAAQAGNAAAAARIAARRPHMLTGDLAGWTSLDIAGSHNPLRFLYKNEAGGIKWMVKNTH
jgi:RHS repeat-associated protein